MQYIGRLWEDSSVVGSAGPCCSSTAIGIFDNVWFMMAEALQGENANMPSRSCKL